MVQLNCYPIIANLGNYILYGCIFRRSRSVSWGFETVLAPAYQL